MKKGLFKPATPEQVVSRPGNILTTDDIKEAMEAVEFFLKNKYEESLMGLDVAHDCYLIKAIVAKYCSQNPTGTSRKDIIKYDHAQNDHGEDCFTFKSFGDF